ncbi:MAG: hypothetical protein ABW007_19080 [Chitinophagaceae bacterium]
MNIVITPQDMTSNTADHIAEIIKALALNDKTLPDSHVEAKLEALAQRMSRIPESAENVRNSCEQLHNSIQSESPVFDFADAIKHLRNNPQGLAVRHKSKSWDHSFLFISYLPDDSNKPIVFYADRSAGELTVGKFRPSNESLLGEWTLSEYRQLDIKLFMFMTDTTSQMVKLSYRNTPI